MAARSEIDVVIPSWNGRDLTLACLEQLAGQTVAVRTTVVDNGSSDGTADAVRERFPGVEVVELATNRGFGAAANAGVARGVAPFVVVVNNDVLCPPQFVERLVAPLRGDSAVGMVASVLVRPDGRIDSYGLEVDRTLAAFNRFEGRRLPPDALDEDGLLGPSGGAAAYRRSAYEAVGGFDERIFGYMEDVDIALRLRGAGWRAAGARRAVATHFRAATFGHRSSNQVSIAGFARAYMVRKYSLLAQGLGRAAAVLAWEAAVVAGEFLLGNGPAAVRGRVRGWRAGGDAPAAAVPREVVDEKIGVLGAAVRRLRAVTT